MNWRAPSVLWWLVFVPVAVSLLTVALRRRRRALRLFAEDRLLAFLTPDLDTRRHVWRAGLLAAALAAALLALAGPRWGFHLQEVRRVGIDVVIALDTSRSMLAEDVKPNRLARAKLAVEGLVHALHGDRVGLVPFAGTAFVQCPLTLDYGAFLESLGSIEVGILPKGGTALAEAINTGLSALAGQPAKHQAIIIITDGEDHEGRVMAAAKAASERGVRLYTVGIGTAGGELIPFTADGRRTFLKDRAGRVVKSRLDAALLQDAAVETGGAYIYDSGPSLGLDELYTRYISKLEKRELTSGVERRLDERFQWPLMVALVCLVIELSLDDRRASASSLAWLGRRQRA